MTNVIGPDISFYENDPQTPQGIDFVKMKTLTDFVIVRAGQNLWADRDFTLNWSKSKEAGLLRGSYWFYDSRANPKRQAEMWVSLMNGDFGELPLFADIEESYNGPYKGWKQWYDFLERLKELVNGKEISIYTAFYYWRDNAPNATTDAQSLEYFHQYPLWIAHYQVAKPSIPKPWGTDEWLFWQFTESGDGQAYGCESKGVDLNYFNGDDAALKARFPANSTPTPTPTPTPGPTPGPGAKYRVTTTTLRMRDGPGTNYNIIGTIKLNDVVTEVSANADRSWIQVKRSDGLVGWCSSDYLKLIESAPTPTPTPTPDPTPTPTPTPSPTPVDTANWYRVTAATLNVRSGPDTTSSLVGAIHADDIVPAIATSDDKNWVQIKRVDGLTGWCSLGYLTLISQGQPDSVRQSLYNGTTYLRRAITTPRQAVVHVLLINLRAGEFHFLVTPADHKDGTLCARKTSEFLSQFSLTIAINGNGFSYVDTSANPADACPNNGDCVKVNGIAASRGNVYAPKGQGPTIYISQKNEFSFDKVSGNIFNAISGDRMVVVKGAKVTNLTVGAPEPRTGLGVSADGRTLILMVVDGRQPGHSDGLMFSELADLLLTYGAYYGVNMDGGGSSTMVIKGTDGNPVVVNIPADQSGIGNEREVANHLGIFIKQ